MRSSHHYYDKTFKYANNNLVMWLSYVRIFQVFIHNPHSRSQRGGRIEIGADQDITLLNINQSVSAVNAGQLDPNKQNDVLVVGTQTNLLVYDVDNNSDLFYKDVSIYIIWIRELLWITCCAKTNLSKGLYLVCPKASRKDLFI